MKPSVIVVDMLEDSVRGEHAGAIRDVALGLVPAINRLLDAAHRCSWPVVFACDAFAPDDFLFGGRMKAHSIRGTPGARPMAELRRGEGDRVLEKPRFSAFFGTDLHDWLREREVDTAVVCGLTTAFCVLATALDAVCHDLHAVIVEDACASARAEVHEACLGCYRGNVLEPLLQVQTVDAVLAG